MGGSPECCGTNGLPTLFTSVEVHLLLLVTPPVAPDDVRSELCAQVVFTVSSFGDGKPFTPQQAFVSLKSAASGAVVVLAAKAGKSAPNEYSVSFTAESIASEIGTQVRAEDLWAALLEGGSLCMLPSVSW